MTGFNIEALFCDKEISDKRIEICRSCSHFDSALATCNLCGCLMHMKTKLGFAHCPIHKWDRSDLQPQQLKGSEND